jgi:hypothetical protein
MKETLAIIGKVVAIAASLVGIGGAIYALMSYHQSVRLKRAEWLQKLYQQFYELDRYRAIRNILDYRPARELGEIHASLQDQSSNDLVKQLWDYLNFFEFVAGLEKLKQITAEDMKLLFEYPLRRISEDERIMAQLAPEGF